MKCKAISGISNICQNAAGGLDKTFWLFFKSDLNTQISLRQEDDISSIDFAPYEGFLRFDGQKFQNQYFSPMVRSQVGNVSYMPSVVVKILSGSTVTDVILQQLSKAQDVIVLVQDNNRKFFIIGAGKGLFVTGDEHGSGQTGDAYVGDTITFTGAELTKPLRFNVGDYNSTLAYITGHESDFIPVILCWILATGFWSDICEWDDTQFWID